MSDLCFVEHDDWSGPHRRLGSCPDEIPTWVKWFINEDGQVYDYDARTQAIDFPNDDHRIFDTEEEAELAAEISAHDTDPDPAGGAPVEQVSYEEALNYAIFAINTFMEPHASSQDDMARLEEHSDQVLNTLIDIRETVRGMGPIEAEIRRRLAGT